MITESKLDGLGSVPLLHVDPPRKNVAPTDTRQLAQRSRISRVLAGEDLQLSDKELALLREREEYPK